jgi:hypothetical protein
VIDNQSSYTTNPNKENIMENLICNNTFRTAHRKANIHGIKVELRGEKIFTGLLNSNIMGQVTTPTHDFIVAVNDHFGTDFAVPTHAVRRLRA